MSKDKVFVEQFDDVLIDWAKDLYAPDPTGKGYIFLGTVVRINNQLIALDPLSDSQIKTLKEVVNRACDHEFERRGKVCSKDPTNS